MVGVHRLPCTIEKGTRTEIPDDGSIIWCWEASLYKMLIKIHLFPSSPLFHSTQPVLIGSHSSSRRSLFGHSNGATQFYSCPSFIQPCPAWCKVSFVFSPRPHEPALIKQIWLIITCLLDRTFSIRQSFIPREPHPQFPEMREWRVSCQTQSRKMELH